LIWVLILRPLVIVAVDQLVIALAEACLVRNFGQPYCDYMARVRRWL
jgi:protein-S-isoprenylcysteine O-methyltransferase Ste14